MTTQPTPETLTELKFNDALRQTINQSYVPKDLPIFMAYVNEDGEPGASYRGSVVAVGDDKIGVWGRNGEGSTMKAIASNANVLLMYREPSPDHQRSLAVVTFRGKARVATDEAERRQVYDTMPQRERDADVEYKGVAIIVDLDSVSGFIPGYRLQMKR
ncbi:MAG TPA: pyridoxamine 5'-phosphate oxidase family protein [Dehalococcoidia bacterium]|nr:pyridoxamine 5'-phosphate oxidase family protein [Dehalococcoidia bacterium]